VTLEDYRGDMENCCRCSICKFVPLERLTEKRYSYVCPSVARYDFNAYSGGGRMAVGIAMLEKRIDFSDKLTDVVYNCQMCGACDISCKVDMDMEVLEPINELRIECVNNGRTLPALDKLIGNMREQGSMVLQPKDMAKRGEWAAGLGIKDASKEKAAVLYHAGCRASSDKHMWNTLKEAVVLLQKAGADIGILGEQEQCCGSRAYQMGYKDDFLKQAKKAAELIKKTGATTLVTGCADCYYAFKVLYDKFGLKGKIEVLHTTEYMDRLIKEGRLKPRKMVAATVTYQDPCHLGRLGEPYIHWKGKLVPGNIRTFDPPKEYRRGTYGVYEPPRNVLKSIPGLKLVEMTRTREYAWCCGGGGGVAESNQEFARWTARERIAEADSTRADVLATACTGCKQNLSGAIKEAGSRIQVLDVVELLSQAI
jgi:Fe-S oxidoreductase